LVDSTVMRCLLVDDDQGIRVAVGRALRALGLDVQAVGSVAAAVALLQRDAYPLALVDVHLPEVDGLKLVAWIRSQAAFADVRIILLTVETSYATMAAAQNAGCDLLLMKPVSAADLEAAVRRLVGRLPSDPS
jgi:DNA-binding response OmpR family regulator